MASEVVPRDIVDVADDGGDDDDVSVIYSAPKPKPEPARSTKRGSGAIKIKAISVENYCQSMEARDLHIAILASLSPQPSSFAGGSSSRRRTAKRRSVIDLSSEIEYIDYDDDVLVLESFNNRKPFRGNGISIHEPGESSNSALPGGGGGGGDDTVLTFVCEICVEPKPNIESFPILGCNHSYCTDCIHKYVASKLQDNITQIQCPVSGCIGLLEPEHCRSILPREVFDRWGDALCEAVILSSHKFYCPFKDCSALLISDDNNENIVAQSECPICRRLFCAQCKVPWHSEIECREYQKLHKDEREREDIMLMNLAKNHKWTRCPKCRIYVERTQGCLFMKCRCGHTFCYNCGAPLVSHYCAVCKH